LVLLSVDHYDWLVAAAQCRFRTIDAPDFIVAAAERAEMDPEHAAPDELLR